MESMSVLKAILFLALHIAQKMHKGPALQLFCAFYQQKTHANPVESL